MHNIPSKKQHLWNAKRDKSVENQKVSCIIENIDFALGSQAGAVDTSHAFHLYYNVVCALSFSRSEPDFEGFLRALRFPPSSKLTPKIQFAGPR